MSERADERVYEPTTTVIPRTVTRVVVPLILVTAAALLLQGHNLPGGGFIGGVLTAIGLALVYVVFGLDYLQRVLGLPTRVEGESQADVESEPESDFAAVDGGLVGRYRLLFALGLALATAESLAPMLFGEPFLSQTVFFVHLPLYGDFEFASAFFFDLGVYLVVVGALLTVVGEVGAE